MYLFASFLFLAFSPGVIFSSPPFRLLSGRLWRRIRPVSSLPPGAMSSCGLFVSLMVVFFFSFVQFDSPLHNIPAGSRDISAVARSHHPRHFTLAQSKIKTFLTHSSNRRTRRPLLCPQGQQRLRVQDGYQGSESRVSGTHTAGRAL